MVVIFSAGCTNTDYAISSTSGVLKVATGKTLAQTTTAKYTVMLGAKESGAAAGDGSTTVSITVGTCGCSALGRHWGSLWLRWSLPFPLMVALGGGG